MVEMPGCVAFGVRLFSECYALEKIGILTEGARKLAEGAVIGPYAFESCGKLEQISLPGVKALSIPCLCCIPLQGFRRAAFIRPVSEVLC